MDAYERALLAMGDQLDENEKKRLRDAAQLLDQGNAETRRTSFAQEQTGIMQDTQQLAGQGLAGNTYSGFQSGAQERRVKTREGVYDMTQNTLNTQETSALLVTGQNMVAQKRAAEEARRQKALELARQRAGLSLAPLVAEKRAFSAANTMPTAQPAAQTAMQTPTKPTAWQAAYDAVSKTTGTGLNGLVTLLNQTPEERRKAQQEIYGAVQNAGGTAAADTMFGANPVKNATDAFQAGKNATVAADVIRRQQERTAPIDKNTATESIKTIDARLDELDVLISQANAQFQYVRSAEQQATALANLNALKAEKAVLEADRKSTDRRMKATIYADYMKLMGNSDFTEKAKANSQETNDFYRGVNGMFAKNDPTGAVKSMNEHVLPLAGKVTTLDGKRYENGVEAGKYITDEEKDVYNYIFATQGAEKAQKYIEDVSSVLNARYAGQESQSFAKMANDAPILASAMTLMATFMKAEALPYAYTAKRDIDPNSPYFSASRFSQIIRSEVAANIADGVGRLDRYSPAQMMKMGYTQPEIDRMMNGEKRAAGSEAVGAAMGFLYQTGMSIADFLLIAQTGSAASLTIMGTGAAADTVMNAKQRGASDGDALALGTVAGIAEVFFEKFSLDNFYKMSTAGRNAVLKNTLAQMGIEASEEFFTECTNILADIYIMGDNSNTKLRINAYKAAGMSQKEAEIAAHMDNFEQVMIAALGGALSGGAIGAGKTMGMRAIQGVKNGVLDLTDPKIQAQLNTDNQKAQAAKQENAAKDASERVKAVNLTDLKATDENPLKATLVDVAAAELKGKGEPDSVVAEVKAVLDKQLRGEPITVAERATLILNPTIREAFNITEPVPTMRVAKNGKMEVVNKTGGIIEQINNNTETEDPKQWNSELKNYDPQYVLYDAINQRFEKTEEGRMPEFAILTDGNNRYLIPSNFNAKLSGNDVDVVYDIAETKDGKDAQSYRIEQPAIAETYGAYYRVTKKGKIQLISSQQENATRELFNITEPMPRIRINENTKTQTSADLPNIAPETNPATETMQQPEAKPDFVNADTATTEAEKSSTKSEVYKEQLAKSFVKDISDSIGLTKESGAQKDLAKAIDTVMQTGKFSSDEQNALFDRITSSLPEGANVARARIAFDDAVFNVRMNLGLVDRYEAARHVKKQQKAARAADANDMPLVKKALEDRKPLARQLQKIKDDNVFTQADTNDIEYILKGGQVNLEGRTNAAAFKQRLEVERKLRAADQIITDYNKQLKKARFDQAVRAVDGSEAWKDKKWGLGYSMETMERNIMDIVPNPAQAELIIKTYLSPIHANEAAATRFMNEYRARVEALGLNNEEFMVVQQIGQNMTWETTEAQLGKNIVDKANKEKVFRAVESFREIYDEFFVRANEELVKNGQAPIEYRKGYYPHFNDPEPDTFMKKIIQAFGVKLSTEELPTDIAGLTETFRPNKSFFGNMLERKGEASTIDAKKGFEIYLQGVANIIFHTEDIMKIRALESAIRYEHSNEAIRKRVLEVVNSPEYDPEKQQEEYDAIFGEKQGHLGKFVTELREYGNLLANKKSMHDRSAEADLGRKMYHVVNTLNSRVAANMIAGNVGVALTNFIPLTQAWASTKTKHLIMGMTQSMASMFKSDGFADRSDFVTNRKGSESLVMTGAQKAAKIAAIPFTLVDNFVSESIVRAQFMQNIEKGMSQEDALQAADEWAGRIMADRSKGALPTYFKRSNPLSKMFGMFQVEVNNQFRHAFKDLPRALRDRGLAAIAMALFKLCLGAWVYNEVTEPLTGRRAAFDPANILMEFGLDLAKKDLGTATLTQFIAGKGDNPWKLEDKDVSTATAIENLWGNLMDQTPFIGSFLGGEGGRVPIASAFPDVWAIGKDVISAMSGDGSWKKAADTAGKELIKPLVYLVPPFGGGQAKKFYDGPKTVAQGGSFSVDDKGEKRIQFSTDQQFTDYLQAALFGKWSLPEAQDYIRNGFDMMTPRESEGWKAARAAGIDTDYMRVRAALAKIEPTKDQYGNTIDSATTLQRRALMNWPGLTPEQKQQFDKYLISNENGRSFDYSNPALLELALIGKSTHEKAITAQRQGIAPETYLDYAQLKKEYDAANDDLTARGQETVSVNERMHDAIWTDEGLSETQKFQLEAAITGQASWTNKAMLAARAAVRNDIFYPIASKVRDYDGNEPISEYAWSVIRANKSLTPEQQLKMQEIVAGADNKTKMDRIIVAGVPKEPAYRYLALYRDYVADDEKNEMAYSDNVTFKLAVSRERGLSPEDKMKITDAVLGSNSKLFNGWQQANVIAGINPKAYYSFQMKWLVLNAKDENGKTIDQMRKQHTKEYLQTLGLTQEQMEYLLFGTGEYKKW